MTTPTETLPAKAQTQNVAVARYDPLKPIGSAGALKSLMDTQRGSLAGMLPKHITPERLFKTMLVATNRNPAILDCTTASILETINRAAELGLDLSGTLGEAYPVPFNNKVKVDGRDAWVSQLQLIIGYRGLEKLAWQSGEVEFIDAECVCEFDEFDFEKGTEVTVRWKPKLHGERGRIIGAYACVKMKSGGKLARFLPVSDLEKIRNSSKSKDSPAWRNWLEEMYRKCALKRTLKDAPLSTEKFVRALETDEADYALTDVVGAHTVRPSVPMPRAIGQAPEPIPDEDPIHPDAPDPEPIDPLAPTSEPTDPPENVDADAKREPETDPIKMNELDVTAWIIKNMSPSGMKEEDARANVAKQFTLLLSAKWNRVPKAERQKLLDDWENKGFPGFAKVT